MAKDEHFQTIVTENQAEDEQNETIHVKKKQILSDYEYEIGKLRRDMEEFKDKILDKLLEVKGEVKSLRASNNASGSRLKGYTIKELMGLKQIGINPKDLLMGDGSISDGETQKR